MHWRDRKAAAREVTGVFAEHRDALSTALREVDGTETVLIDFWWQTPLPTCR